MDLARTIDITDNQRHIILALFAKYLPNVMIWAYGSRVKGTARPHSDLDLVAFTSSEQKRAVSDLKEALEESNLPFRVDLFTWNEIPEQFKKNIEHEHVDLIDDT